MTKKEIYKLANDALSVSSIELWGGHVHLTDMMVRHIILCAFGIQHDSIVHGTMLLAVILASNVTSVDGHYTLQIPSARECVNQYHEAKRLMNKGMTRACEVIFEG